MTEAERSLLQMVYDYFHEHAKWPRSRWVEVEFSEEVDFAEIAGSLRSTYMYYGDPIYENSTCNLTIRGLSECEGSARDLENFVRAIPLFARAYKDDLKVTREEVMRELEIEEMESHRLFELLHVDGTLTSGGSGSAAHWEYFGASQAAFRLRKVKSVQEYIEEKQRLYAPFDDSDVPESSAAEEPLTVSEHGPVPEVDLTLIADPALRAIIEADLLELTICYRNGAWKSVGLLAGSCCEAMLIDLLARNPLTIPGKHAAQWKSKLSLKDLAQHASDAGLISPEGYVLVQTVRRWRDLVHPWRATSERQPSRAIARTMLTFLELVTHDLEAHRPPTS